MTEAEIERGVKEILAKRLNIDIKNINSDSKLVDDLGMDSFGAIEVVFELEDRFKIEISEKDLAEAKRVEDVVKYIYSKKI
ncbi:MAG: acyl carrier protein [Candidatus Omnitrophica bacterium]|nr:acyl carrier protein [Candidatus Omnitrophota bacterium]